MHVSHGFDNLYETIEAEDECALEIKYEHNYQIDYYKLNIYGSSFGESYQKHESTYALLYVDSFKIVKVKKNDNVYSYNCQLELLMPSAKSYETLDERTDELLRKSVFISHEAQDKSKAQSFILTAHDIRPSSHAKRELVVNKKRLSISHEFNVKADKDKSLVCHLALYEDSELLVYREQIFKNFEDYKQVENFQSLASTGHRSSVKCNLVTFISLLSFILVLF